MTPVRLLASFSSVLFAAAIARAQPAPAGPEDEPAPGQPADDDDSPEPTASPPDVEAPAEPAPAEPAASESAAEIAGPAPLSRCLRAEKGSQLARTLRGARVLLDDSELPLSSIALVGSRRQPREIWQLVHDDGVAPDRVDGEVVSRIIVRLMESGLFESITPTLKVESAGDQASARVELILVEHPPISRVDFQGLREIDGRELLGALIRVPGQEPEEDDDGIEAALVELGRELDRERHEEKRQRQEECPRPVPPVEWLARIEDGDLKPGVLWGGVEPALERVLAELRDEGYEQASLSANLGADGALTIDIDEGMLKAVEVRGVHPAIEDEVRALLGVRAGAPFFEADLESGVDAVTRRFPFLRPDGEARATLGPPRIVRDESGRRFQSVASECVPSSDDDSEQNDHDEDDWRLKQKRTATFGISADSDSVTFSADVTKDPSCRASYYQLVEGTLVVHFHEASGELDVLGEELFRHTPVTGYAPGIDILLHKWDGQDRLHLHVGTSVHVNTSRASRAPVGDALLDEIGAKTRLDWMLMAATEFPGLMHAELGAEFHSRTDTSDRWRMSRNESHLYSMIINRPEAEYYRRTGASVFATLPVNRGPTLGAEYRYDLYGSLDSLNEPYTWFRQDEPGHPNPPIDEGRMGSGVLRLEWGLGGLAPDRKPTSILRRYPGVSLYGDRSARLDGVGFKTMNTLEVSREGFGSREDLTFTRFISDNLLHLPTAHRQGLSIRARVETMDEDGPRQKEAALGGWGSLRGYQFKRLRGSAMSLFQLEYHFRSILAFVDFGAVREEDGWSAPGPGLGTALLVGDGAELSFAWRTDEDAKGTPNVRLLFGRQF